MEENKTILFITKDAELKKVIDFCFKGWGYSVFFDDTDKPNIDEIIRMSPGLIVVDTELDVSSGFEACEMLKKDFATAYVPVIILIEKKELRQRLLGLRQVVDDYLIKPPDPLELRIRGEMAMKRSRQNLHANSLTGLSGGIVIEDILKKKIEKNDYFVVGHIDIDNFKSFNDKYGYLKGDRIIMQTAYMLNASIREFGNKDDFIGHIGGDDFVIVTTAEKYNDISKDFICKFDTITPFHYHEKDRKHGYLTARDRMNNLRKIPIMSVTVALVMKNSDAEVKSIIELNERIAEVKKYLKGIPGSKYMADRRVIKKSDYLRVQLFRNDESVVANYKPLGQILLENHAITMDQLDKALKAHWKRNVPLGEVLKDMGLITETSLSEALLYQENELGKGKNGK